MSLGALYRIDVVPSCTTDDVGVDIGGMANTCEPSLVKSGEATPPFVEPVGTGAATFTNFLTMKLLTFA